MLHTDGAEDGAEQNQRTMIHEKTRSLAVPGWLNTRMITSPGANPGPKVKAKKPVPERSCHGRICEELQKRMTKKSGCESNSI
ncbi:MAG: hypothetical protein IGS50_22820 [Synechococcales cyanobacterium C42_A2020_086]|jgi:hypothetical protein|nr:hypothetical protein [Synechococcales cyanobacterium C42_A2020_086]